MLLEYFFLLGIIVEAMSGTLAAGRHNMDLAGVFIIANVTAFGGGALRDLAIANYPLTWVEHPEYVLYTTFASVIAMLIAKYIKRLYTVFLILDAIGLVTFSLIATKIAVAHSLSPIVACVLAIISGASGGMIRDILCHEIPLIFRKELYVSVSLFTAISYLILSNKVFPNHLFADEIIALVLAFLMRVLAIRYKIHLPKFDFKH